jgi:hypothetical protein
MKVFKALIEVEVQVHNDQGHDEAEIAVNYYADLISIHAERVKLLELVEVPKYVN